MVIRFVLREILHLGFSFHFMAHSVLNVALRLNLGDRISEIRF